MSQITAPAISTQYSGMPKISHVGTLSTTRPPPQVGHLGPSGSGTPVRRRTAPCSVPPQPGAHAVCWWPGTPHSSSAVRPAPRRTAPPVRRSCDVPSRLSPHSGFFSSVSVLGPPRVCLRSGCTCFILTRYPPFARPARLLSVIQLLPGWASHTGQTRVSLGSTPRSRGTCLAVLRGDIRGLLR